MTELDQFFTRLNGCVEQDSFVKLILGKYRGNETDLRNIEIKPVTIRSQDFLSFIYRYQTKDITKNFLVKDGIEIVRGLLGRDFKSANLFSLTEDVQMEFNKKGKCMLGCSKATCSNVPVKSHNREKHRLMDQNRPFLTALGITNDEHQVLPSMSRKWKQINVFLEIFQQALLSSKISKTQNINVVDFGSGKGYLTFAVYDFLRNSQWMDAQVTGVELREDLVRFCNDVAIKHEMDKLHFCQGDLKSYSPGKINVMIALHACDTATDLAIHMGIRSGAEIIMCSPCCHKELRQKIIIPPELKPILRFGVHLGQEAEMVTDSLRALFLEASGYETKVFEFISLEHTDKNKMILAVKGERSPDKKEEVLSQINVIKDFYGIKEINLETMLKTATDQQ
ncbi:MAG: SAM-dependent methyltransferase [Victivallales bacterium]